MDRTCCKCGKKEKFSGLDRMHLEQVAGLLYCPECLIKKTRENDPEWHCSNCSPL